MLNKVKYVKTIKNLNYSLIPDDEIFLIKSKEVWFVFPQKFMKKYTYIPLKIKGEEYYLIEDKIHKSKDAILQKKVIKTIWKSFDKSPYLIVYDPYPNKSTLNEINEHKNDKYLKLDESIDEKGNRKHDYYFKGEKVKKWVNVTKFVSIFFPFDAEKIAGFIAKKTNRSKYSILKEWKHAATQGSKVHKIINNLLDIKEVYTGEEFKIQYDQALNYLKYMKKRGYFPYRSEWSIFNEQLKTMGTPDVGFYSPFEKKYIWTEFKTTKRFIKKLRSHHYSPLSMNILNKLKDGEIKDYRRIMEGLPKRNKFIQYSLQLGIYKHLLDTNYGDFECDEMHIVRLNKNIKDYELTKVNPLDMEFRIKKLFELRNFDFI